MRPVGSLYVALAVISLQCVSADWKQECSRYCTHSKNDVAADALVQHCETYRYVLPKPKVYQKCERAFKAAITSKCGPACKDMLGHINPQEDASHHCKAEKNQVPRPVSHEACMKGYVQGSLAILAYANGLKQQAAEAEADSGVDAMSAQQSEAEEAQAMAEAAAEAARQAAAKAQAAADAAAKRKAEQAASAAAADGEDASEDDELAAAREAARAAYAAEQARRKAEGGGVSNEL